MAATLKVRAGSSFKVQLTYEQSDGTLIDTSDMTARVQLRGVQPPSRVLLDAVEYSGSLPAPVGTILTRLEPGRWELFLGKTFTGKLPPTVRWEFEITSNTNPEDTQTIASGVLLTEPEGVFDIE